MEALETESSAENKFLIRKFFGFFPEKIYQQLHSLGYNEFLKAVFSLKEALSEEFPDKKDLVGKLSSEMLEHFESEYEVSWYEPFTQYCDQNVFKLPPNLPVYGEEMKNMEAGEAEEYKVLQDRLLAQEHLRRQLVDKLENIEEEIDKRKMLLEKLAHTEELVLVAKRCQVLDERIRAARAES